MLVVGQSDTVVTRREFTKNILLKLSCCFIMKDGHVVAMPETTYVRPMWQKVMVSSLLDGGPFSDGPICDGHILSLVWYCVVLFAVSMVTTSQ